MKPFWFTGAPRVSKKSGLKFVTPKAGEALRPVSGKTAAKLGVAAGSVFVRADAKRVTKNTLFVSNRQAKEARAAERYGERRSLEWLAERRASKALDYKSAASEEQAAKQRETRLQKRLLREIDKATTSPFTRQAESLRSGHDDRPKRYEVSWRATKMRAVLRRKLVDKKYVEDGEWHQASDWLRAHSQEELLKLFRTRGASTPSEAGIVVDGDFFGYE